jgi:hypothetical protein
MYTFTTQDNMPILIRDYFIEDVYQLNPFSYHPTRVRWYNGDGIFAHKHCFNWIAENNIQLDLQCDERQIMRDAGEVLFNNVKFYQIGGTIYFLRKPNPLIIDALMHAESEFKSFKFKQMTHIKQIQEASVHEINRYLPILFPIKFSTVDWLSYYDAPASELVHC